MNKGKREKGKGKNGKMEKFDNLPDGLSA